MFSKAADRRYRGLTSLDALIMFIAIFLTVAVAAIVLITTGQSFTQKEISQSVEARKSVTAGIEVINVYGTDPSPAGDTPHRINNLFAVIRLLPGTAQLPLNSTLIFLEVNGGETMISFKEYCYEECISTTTNRYNVFYMKTEEGHEDGYVRQGDVAKLSIRINESLHEDEAVRISFVPPYGPKTIIAFSTPQNMIVRQQSLWPLP